MHEYSIVQALIDRVESEARARGGDRRAPRARLRSASSPASSRSCCATAFATFRERTLCERAPLDDPPVAARWDCPRCRREIPRGAILRCARLRRAGALWPGDEIILERIEMEVP